MMKFVSRHIVPFVCLTAFGLLLPALSQSATLAQLSLDRLVDAAHIVVRAKAIENDRVWRDGEIWTITRFHVVENWKGECPPEIQVWMIGGQIGRVISYVPGAPRFRPNEEVVLFLEPTRTGELSITAWSEGTFRLHFDTRTGEPRVTQDSAVFPEYDGMPHPFRHVGIWDWPLSALKLRVKECKSGAAQ